MVNVSNHQSPITNYQSPITHASDQPQRLLDAPPVEQPEPVAAEAQDGARVEAVEPLGGHPPRFRRSGGERRIDRALRLALLPQLPRLVLEQIVQRRAAKLLLLGEQLRVAGGI